jgi:hypothetical protein
VNNALNFTLGLSSGGFLRGLAGAAGSLKGFIVSAVGVGALMKGVWEAIERGGRLQDLSARTGESVGNLYQLQEAFKVAGISADSVAPMLLRLQRSLGGVDEMGKSTAAAFAQLGIGAGELGRMTAPRQLAAVADALSRMNRGDAAQTAARLFGREGAGNILQISRDMAGFVQSLRNSAAAAALFQRNAAAFDKIGDTITLIKSNVGGFFAGIAAGIAPGLQNVLDGLARIDLVGMGRELGRFLTAISQAFKTGTLSELIGESLKLSLDLMLIYSVPIFEKMGYYLLKAFETPLIFFQAGLEYAIERATWQARFPDIAKKMNREVLALEQRGWRGELEHPEMMRQIGEVKQKARGEAGLRSFAQIQKEWRETGPMFDLGAGAFGSADIQADADKRMAEASKRGGDRLAEFGAIIARLTTGAPALAAGAKPKMGGLTAGGAEKVNSSALEKMGLVFRGGAGDHAATTARNTGRMVSILYRISNQLGGQFPTASFANA